MNIQWSITKERGNFRPVLRYTARLSEFEQDLGLPMVRIESTIPKPPDVAWTYCWPGQNERGPWEPAEFHLLMTPSHKTGELSEALKLPWREDNSYPEVAESFAALRAAFEAALAQAVQSAPMQENGSLETTAEAKRLVAPAFAAQRLLQLVRS